MIQPTWLSIYRQKTVEITNNKLLSGSRVSFLQREYRLDKPQTHS
ncbi:hypothetical protein HMPREF1981_00924 [Bacteroides pyogenes F0041]|uniref:Uncharacterized protein n=1 Tax=Bacteroides pyogenes F0041 TaxID=1321819 RepID=U2C7E8_9BACE|nr:hypothetical protein HMPREF1981_00924 [Bacteroides pyogenes F0041]